MFGYIKVYKPELRLKEWEMYRAVYCTLCKNMGKRYGFLTRFTLSYDFTFLCLLNMALNEKNIDVCRKKCTVNPLKKCNFCQNNDDDFAFPSAAAMIMVYYKFADNTIDEKGVKKLLYKLLKSLFSKAHKKAAQDFPEVENIIKEYISEQANIEKSDNDNLDMAANPTATALAKLFMLCSNENFNRRALERLGYCMGRYIYICDAVADRSDDIKKNRYNPLKNDDGYIERAEIQITAGVNESVKAFELLDIYKLKNILGNIIYLGLENTKKELF